MKKICSALIVSGLALLTAGSALAETRVYIGPAGGQYEIDERGRHMERRGWGGHGRPDRDFDRDHGHRPPPRVVIRERNGDADIAAGVMGFLGGFVAGSALDNNGRIPVVRQYRDRYDPPRQLIRPWSTSWYRWCDARYRSFDPRTGTYRDHDGRVRFCEARG
jgi:hypothetical protein|nr:BA14K family protein [Neorhizobium tomejilense]